MEFKGKWWWMIIVVIMVISFEAGGCLHQERAALLELKALFNGKYDGYQGSDCCKGWAGVTCGPDGRVSSLSLSGYLKEELHFNASLLLHFQELRELYLSDNYILGWGEAQGSMKLSLSLAKLEVLDLSMNHLESSILGNLSGFQSLRRLVLRDFSGFHNLEELDLSENQIDSLIIHKGCGQMHKLRQLDLHQNELGMLPSCFGGLTALTQLDLSQNQFTGGIPPCLQNLADLRKVDLSYNHFSGNIPSWLGNWVALERLDLSNNEFTGNIVSSPLVHILSLEILVLSKNRLEIPLSFKPLAHHAKLKYFVADSNRVISDNSELDAQAIVFPSLQLEVLVLSNCGLITYPPFLHLQHNLTYIDLSHNPFKWDFPTWLLENNFQLDTLILRNSSLIGALRLPSFAHAHIRKIDITQNKIQGQIPANIAAVFPQLQVLSMSNNALQGDIPFNLCDIEPLSELYLSNNQLSEGLGNLAKACLNLTVLRLSHNCLQGDIPSFYSLSALKFLDLQGNNFSGSINTNMVHPNLEMLVLSNNSLEGSIPEDFCKLDNLVSLDLSYNKLNGSIPSCLYLPGIEFLYLNNNKLSVQMTGEFRVTSLATLDLSNNKMGGQIPSWIGNLTSLGALLLRGNQLHGHISVELCKLVDLSILDLSHNHLSGPIPPCLSHISFSGSDLFLTAVIATSEHEPLVDQNVKLDSKFDEDTTSTSPNRANFTTKGTIYSYKGMVLSSMSGLDLSCNRLTGEIPLELGNLSSLHALNLSHNSLWGSIPASFSKMNQLESLDLSYNSLTGDIPIELAVLTALEVFSIAYNSLSGVIPFKAQFATFDASSYEGNRFLCGPPLANNSCTPSELPSINASALEEDEWIDMEAFYMSFAGSCVTMFVGVVALLWINPHWSRVWFYLPNSKLQTPECDNGDTRNQRNSDPERAMDGRRLELVRDKHAEYLINGLRRLPPSFCVLDAKLLDKRCNVFFMPEYLMLMPHLATTYAAVNSLITLGGHGALSSINRDKVYAFLRRMKDRSGCFRMHEKGELDVRACYTAISVNGALRELLILSKGNLRSLLLPTLAVKFVGGILEKSIEAGEKKVFSCQTYEGGIAGEPGSEAHGGYTFCALATMILINEAHRLDLPALINWVVFRQGVEGGFQGRTNKLVDGCYSFWQEAVSEQMQMMNNRRQEGSFGSQPDSSEKEDALPEVTSQLGKNHWGGGPQCAPNVTKLSDVGLDFVKRSANMSPLFHNIALQQYIILCSQVVDGGLRDKPGKGRDFYHTCYCLSGLSVCQHITVEDSESSPLPQEVLGPYSNLLEQIHPLYNVVLDRYDEAHEFFSSF
ncbi:hypothetical protein Cgig2_006769 [Carnegiea gigantea]|uniref:Prenyltransferase alpha-alpha toroid domain-containing protein n=2 Tax=Magnoliopsida TaxID=3398 RepID=A0A9Q1JK71_9CARY|nr:hypothetical protein Cgig2_006769 [Carnegiea gigantea]